MKLISFLSIFTATVVTSSLALANVSKCSEDEYTTEKIQKDFAEKNQFGDGGILEVKNFANETVGVVMFDETSDGLDALYLCGANSGYYYLDGMVDDLMSGAVSINNDEYEGDIIDSSFDDITQSSVLKVSIKFTGDEEDADYAAFTSVIVVDMKKLGELPKSLQK